MIFRAEMSLHDYRRGIITDGQCALRVNFKLPLYDVSRTKRKAVAGELCHSLNIVGYGKTEYEKQGGWWAVRDSNPRLPACKAGALTN